MALAVDATTPSQNLADVGITFAHTCSGSERLLVVLVGGRASTFITGQITGVTYNGVAMTLSQVAEYTIRNSRTYVFTLIAPAAGTHNVVISKSTDGSNFYGDAVAISFTGADQASPVFSIASENADVTVPTSSFDIGVTPTAGGYMVGVTALGNESTSTARDSATTLHNIPAWYGTSLASYKLNGSIHGWDMYLPVGSSHRSSAVIFIKPSGLNVPDAPVILTASGGNTQASVPFRAGASDGGSPVTSFRAISTPGSFTSPASLVSPLVVTGLTNGTAYTFTVRATNANGNSLESAASNSVTPAAASGGKSIFASGIFGRN